MAYNYNGIHPEYCDRLHDLEGLDAEEMKEK